MRTSWLLGFLLFAAQAAHGNQHIERCQTVWDQPAPEIAQRLDQQMSDLAGSQALRFLAQLIPQHLISIDHLPLAQAVSSQSKEIAPDATDVQFIFDYRQERIAMTIQWLRKRKVLASQTFRAGADFAVELLNSRVRDTFEVDIWGSFGQRPYLAGKSLLLVFSRAGQLQSMTFTRFHHSQSKGMKRNEIKVERQSNLNFKSSSKR